MKMVKLAGITVVLSLFAGQANANAAIQTYAHLLAGNWYTYKWIDDFTDEEHQLASVYNMDGDTITVKCFRGADFEIAIEYMSSLDSESKQVPTKYRMVSTKYRIDKNTPVEFDWFNKDRTIVIFDEPAEKLTRELLEGTDRIVIQTSNYNNDRVKIKFSLGKAKRHIQSLLKQCGIE